MCGCDLEKAASDVNNGNVLWDRCHKYVLFLWSFGRLRGLNEDWKIWIIYFSGTGMCAARILLMNERSSSVSVASPSSSVMAVTRGGGWAAAAAASAAASLSRSLALRS
jgi:hypothetical protein